MLNSEIATRELLSSEGQQAHEALLTETSRVPISSGVRVSTWSIPRWRSLTAAELAVLVSLVLFALGAWPVLLTEVPPYQDLPNHLASLTVIENLRSYPEYVFNGFFKTNAALFTWLFLVGKLTGVKVAARLFALMVLALNAWVIPRFVLHFTASSRKMLVASLFAFPMIHNWFISMGMLDFALAVPISLALLMALERWGWGEVKSKRYGAAAIIGLGVATWYAHVFPILVVHLLVLIEVFTRPLVGGSSLRAPGLSGLAARFMRRLRVLHTKAFPLFPVTVLSLFSIGQHIRDTVGPMAGFMDKKLVAPWELVYNLWAEWFWGFTTLSATSIVPCVFLAVIGGGAVLRRASRREHQEESPIFFSGWAFLVIGLLYCFIPYKMTNWFHVNSRLIPYLWIGLLLFVPKSLPRWLVATLGVSGVLYSGAMGFDYLRLDRERQEFTAGMEAVPEGSRLLPLLFHHKSTSENTRNLLHMWGYYVTDRRTSAPLLFAHSHSFPVTYSEPPPIRFNHLVLEAFAPEASTPETVCQTANRYDDCDALFNATWDKFYSEATPRFDHLLLWDPTPEAVAVVPADYQQTYQHGRLTIYARKDVLAAKTARR